MINLKKIILLIIFILLVFSEVVVSEDNIIFNMIDPVGDEYGPGTYVYPKSEQFTPYEGLFDITEFKVDEEGEKYNFYFKFVKLTNPWHAKYGFSHQLIQVYISNKEEGKVETFKPGANIRFESNHPWNKLIKITGWSLEAFDYQDSQEVNRRIEEEIKVLDDKKTIKVSVPKKLLGDLSKAQYYVLIGALDGFAYDNYREVVKNVEGWKFGGGDNTDYDPNVLDILVPEGMSQKDILGSFDLEKGELAILRAVGPELGLHWKFIIIFGFLFIFLATIVGAGMRYFFSVFNNYQQ